MYRGANLKGHGSFFQSVIVDFDSHSRINSTCWFSKGLDFLCTDLNNNNNNNKEKKLN